MNSPLAIEIAAGSSADSGTVPSFLGRPAVDGKFLTVGGERFWIKGVTYGSFSPNDEGEPFPPFAQVRDDFAFMRKSGINAVRLYTPPSDRIADAAFEAGLFLIPDICWGPRKCELDDPDRMKFIESWVVGHSRRLAGHRAILMYSIGNEIPPLIVRWYGRKRIEQFLYWLYGLVKDAAPAALVTYANHPPTEHLGLAFLDVVSCNVYLEREADFRKYLARLQMLAGDRPLFLAEIGLDSARNGLEAQASFLDWQLRAVWEKGLCGAVVYSWTDEWSIHGQEIEGWNFGLTDADRRPKPALAAVSENYLSDHYALRAAPWPRVSVVVASYNGARTLEECLLSLQRLNYPNFEVIVIDDGSTDATAEIVVKFSVRPIHVPNGGLSQARNLGISAATGEIVAFLDSDAYADPDWLYYIVSALEEHEAAAVGGPNLSPPQDGFMAQCVDFAPGNPIHVLTDDELAEHVPGCNMAFRKEKLAQIGNFNPAHRAAGDDVDVCWKLLFRGEKVAFSSGAVVWHHRRPSLRTFWRQQVGYGFAEAHLQHRYPARFNCFGDLVWSGSIYDGTNASLRRDGIPSLFRPQVYQGRFGSAQFQSLYQPFLTWWFQIFTTAEWFICELCVLLVAVLAFSQHPVVTAVAGGLFAGMLSLTLGSATIAGGLAGKNKKWEGARLRWGRACVAGLHIVQPIARTVGRLHGLWATRRLPQLFGAQGRLYGNLTQRELWLESLQRHLRTCGWVCRECDEWSDADLEILGPGPYTARLFSVYEEDLEHGRFYVRYRLTARPKPVQVLLLVAIESALVACVAMPFLLPLAVPLLVALWIVLTAKRSMIRAISQLAVDCGDALGMTRAEEPWL